MTTPAWYEDIQRRHGAQYTSTAFGVDPSERIGPPLANRRIRLVLKLAALAAVTFAAGSAVVDETSTARWLWQTGQAFPQPYIERMLQLSRPAQMAEPAAPSPPPLEPTAPIVEKQVATIAIPTAQPSTMASAPAAEEKPDEQDGANAGPDSRPAPLPKPEASDPLQKRALAIGLHPNVPRSLLERMTEVDFRNAAIAIRTALAETREGEELIWPRQVVKGQARFRVTFVRGASEDCRRYVLGVAKDGWLTTAPAMEKCGERVSSAPPRRK